MQNYQAYKVLQEIKKQVVFFCFWMINLNPNYFFFQVKREFPFQHRAKSLLFEDVNKTTSK